LVGFVFTAWSIWTSRHASLTLVAHFVHHPRMTTRPQPIPLRPDPEALQRRAMDSLIRSCIVAGASRLDQSVPSEVYAARRWGDDAARDIAQFARAASAPAMTSVPGWAAEATRTTAVFLRNLVGYSAGAQILAAALGLTFDGYRQINLPSVATDAALPDFVGEGAPAPTIQGLSGAGPSLLPFKFAQMVVLSREMIEASSAEMLVRDALLQSAALGLDRRLFDNAASAADLRPAGLLHGITPLTPSAATSKTDALADDMQALLSSVGVVGGSTPILFVCSPKQAAAISVRLYNSFAYLVLRSSQLPPGTVVAIAAAGVASASGAEPTIDTSSVAEVVMNDAPGPPSSSAPVASLFQADAVGLRLRWPLSWAVRDSRAIAYMTGVSW
jgi:hypothetical protein